jgi:hypothetical protein
LAVALTERDRKFFELIRRYKNVTPAILRAQVCEDSESIAKKIITKYCDYIASDPLGTRTVSYRFKPAGAKLMGAPEELARPSGPQSLPKALGIADFCCSATEQRTRYLRHEFVEDFPELAKDLLGKDYHTDFFLDHDGTHARLGQIVVDLGGDFRKLISKCRVRLREYLDFPHVRDIVADGLFTIAIVVAEEEKAQAIRVALNEKPLRARVIVETSTELQKYPIQIGSSS